MKFGAATKALLFVASAATLSTGVSTEETKLRGLQKGNGKAKAFGKMRQPCTILAKTYLKIPGYEGGNVRGLQSGSDENAPDETFDCELDPADAPNGRANQIVRLNLDESQEQYMREELHNGGLESGSSTYFDPDADVLSEEVVVPKGKKVGWAKGKKVGWAKNGKNSGGGRRLAGYQASGVNREYLFVRITDSTGRVYSHDATLMGDNVFGTNGDPVNLKSQAAACSYNKLTITEGVIPQGAESAPGVIDVTIDIPLEGSSDNAILSAAKTAAASKLGFSLPGRYSNVLFSVQSAPGGWAAYAYINRWDSMYQSEYYSHVGVLMHELGHNWGMAHSGGLNGATYTDHTGLMGNPLYSDDVGKMCFNPAKNWYVGWYEDAKDTIDPRTESPWTGRVVGIADYSNRAGNPVVVKIETGTDDDLFIGFNRASGVNSQNDEGDDVVTIVETGNNGNSYSQSFLKAKLGFVGDITGSSYTITNWQGTGADLVVTVNGINLSANPAYADIEVKLGGEPGPPPPPPPSCYKGDITITINTDNYPDETSFTLKRGTTTIVTGGGYQDSNTAIVYNENLDDGEYTFEINDTYGDGICCGYGEGSYSIVASGSTPVASGGNFGSSETKTFTVCNSASIIGETGRVRLGDTIERNVVEPIEFRNQYVDPVIVAFINTRDGGQSVESRVRNIDVGAGTFELFMQEPDNQGHADETVSYIVMEKGRHTLANGMVVDAGSVETNIVHAGGQSFDGTLVEFDQGFFSGVPAVVHSLNTYNNQDFMASLATAVNKNSCKIGMEAAESSKTAGLETVAYMAFSVGAGTTSDGVTFEAGVVFDGNNDGVDNSPMVVEFTAGLFNDAPDVVVSVYGQRGRDGSWARGADRSSSATGWTATQQTVYAEEDQVANIERAHTWEFFAFAAFPPNSTISSASATTKADAVKSDIIEYAFLLDVDTPTMPPSVCLTEGEQCTSDDQCCSGDCKGNGRCKK